MKKDLLPEGYGCRACRHAAIAEWRPVVLREQANFLNNFKLIWVVQTATQKYSAFQNWQISCINPLSPCRQEGRFAIVTKRGAGCDGRLRRQACFGEPGENAAAYGEVVWSWRRDRGVYAGRQVPQATVTRNAAHRGEHV